MDETPELNSPKPKTHRRHTSITTIADNVNSDDSASISSKGSNSTTSSVVSIRVRPKTPDLPPPGSETIVLDNNSNEVQKKPENRTYPKEVPQSKVHYYKPHAPVDSKPRPLTHSYKYFSGPPRRYRDYKYRDYKAKNTDIPKYKEHKYREYNKYREYKLTPWNTFWLGGYKENLPKPVPKKPKPVGRPKKPPKKIGILSAYSLFYPYREFKYRPYEKVKEYRYRDFSGYKEYTGYREYKGRQVPLSTHYDFIGIWRPLGSKGPIPWRKSKTFDPPSRYVYPPVDDEKFFDPPARYINQPSAKNKSEGDAEDEDLSKVYDPPQRLIQPHVDTSVITEDEKFLDPPERAVDPTEDPVYTEETKVLEPPQRVILLSVPAVEVDPVEITPIVTAPLTAAPIEYDEEHRIYDPPQRSIEAPKEYVEESRDYDPPVRQLTAPREYVEETKEYDPPVNTMSASREYVEESRHHDPPSKTIIAPREYIEEEKILDRQEKQLCPPTEAADPVNEQIVPEVTQPQVFAQPINTPPEVSPNYEPEEKVLDAEERQILPPSTKNEDSPLYEVETKIFDPEEKLVNVPSEELSDVSEEEKTLELPERQLEPPDKNNVQVETNEPNTLVNTSPNQTEIVPDTAEKVLQENQEPSVEYREEIKAFSPQQQCMAEPTGIDGEPITNQDIEKEERESVKEDNSLQKPTESYEEEFRMFSPRAAQKTPPPVAPTRLREAEILQQTPTSQPEPVITSEPPAAASGNAISPENYTEETRIFSPVSAQKDPPHSTAMAEQEKIVPEDTEPVVRNEPTSPGASVIEPPPPPEGYKEESKEFSPVPARKSPPPVTPTPFGRERVVAQEPAEEPAPRATSEPAPAASGHPPEPPKHTPTPHDIKEAWQPQPQKEPPSRTPSVAKTVPKEDNERPASQPASESSVINPGLPDSRQPSPDVKTQESLKSPAPPTTGVPSEGPIPEPIPVSQSSPICTADTVIPQETRHSPELPSSTKTQSPAKAESPCNQDPPKSVTPSADVGVPIADPPAIPVLPQSTTQAKSEDLGTADAFPDPDEKAPDTRKSASPNPSLHTNPTPVRSSPNPINMDVSLGSEQSSSPHYSPDQQSLIATPVPSVQNETAQARNPTPQSDGKPPAQDVTDQSAGSPKQASVPRNTRRPAVQPVKPASPVASVAKPVASASSGFPVSRPDSPYKKASPRVQVSFFLQWVNI